MKYITQSKSSS